MGISWPFPGQRETPSSPEAGGPPSVGPNTAAFEAAATEVIAPSRASPRQTAPRPAAPGPAAARASRSCEAWLVPDPRAALRFLALPQTSPPDPTERPDSLNPPDPTALHIATLRLRCRPCRIPNPTANPTPNRPELHPKRCCSASQHRQSQSIPHPVGTLRRKSMQACGD